jgi:hypothetical protein
VLAAVLGGVVAAPAVAGAATVACGEVLTQDTLVDNDLRCEGSGLVAGADGITIDLGGHELVHVDPEECCLQANGVDTGAFAEVEVRNGAIRRFDCGVQLRGASSVVSDLVLRRNGSGVCLEFRSQNNILIVGQNQYLIGW